MGAMDEFAAAQYINVAGFRGGYRGIVGRHGESSNVCRALEGGAVGAKQFCGGVEPVHGAS